MARRAMNRLSKTATLLASLALVVAAPAADTVNGIAALVGNSLITFEQVQRLTARPIELFRGQYAGQPELLRQRILEVQRDAVERLVERRLILQEFEDLKVNIPDSIIADRVDEEIKERYGDRTRLTRSLQEQGITFETFRRDIREQFIEIIMRNRHVPRDILISPGRIEKFYRENEDKFRINDQIKLRMIVIEKSRNSADPLRLGREILAKLDDGADFAEMASVYSDGSQAREGGSWGWVDRKVLREDLAELAFAMPAGKRSDLIEKPEGVYIMLVEEVRQAHVRPIEEVREEIERTLVTNEKNRLHKQWLERLRKKAFVRFF
jgi:parvulin-like peptidyl-prolyl isomerase